MRWELGAVCIMSPIKRDQSRRGAADFSIRPSDDTDAAAAAREEGRRRRGKNRKPPRSPRFAPHMWISPFSKTLHLSWGRACTAAAPPAPPSFQLKHQIMNSLFQQEAIRTECPFKFELITNNLHVHSREL